MPSLCLYVDVHCRLQMVTISAFKAMSHCLVTAGLMDHFSYTLGMNFAFTDNGNILFYWLKRIVSYTLY